MSNSGNEGFPADDEEVRAPRNNWERYPEVIQRILQLEEDFKEGRLDQGDYYRLTDEAIIDHNEILLAQKSIAEHITDRRREYGSPGANYPPEVQHWDIQQPETD